jgi:uncharacterized membrane-anchored protein YhcB (DUF1043 family)
MAWIVGLAGLIGGFVIGQLVLMRLLKDKTRYDLLHDKDLRLKYGLFNWLIAILACLSSLWMYRHYFD